MIPSQVKKTLISMCSDFADCVDIFETHFYLNKPQRVLEVGVGVEKPWKDATGCGQSYATFLILCQLTGAKSMISIDIDDISKTVRRAHDFILSTEIPLFERSCWDRIHSLDFPVKQYFPCGIDLLFLDSSHDADTDIQGAGGRGMTYREICHFSPYITNTGSIFLHDSFEYYQPRNIGDNVQGAVENFLIHNKNWMAIEHNTKTGLCELRRKK
jgi:hypothetical protein